MTTTLESRPQPGDDTASVPLRRRGRGSRLLRGPAHDPRWVRPALLGLLGAAAVLYIWGLGASGWANDFYSAAVQAGSRSWKAFFFGASDAGSFITVDKPPASLWLMDLSARLFGVSSWSILVPNALEGVAAVGLLFATVRRRFGPGAGLLAGAVMALTPVGVLMFRFNNPDSLMVLLLVAGAYALTRALETASTRWLLLCAALVGTGFLAKMMQALLVVPAFAVAYLVAAPTPLRRRLVQLLAAGAALVASAGWWVAVVAAVPASARPYIGGSQTNSILELIFGYNGFGRLTGNENGSVGGGAAGTAGRWGATGLTRLFGADMGGQVSWLLPAALLLLVVGLVLTRRAPRTDGVRAAFVVWGGWLVVTGLTISLAQGIIHPYYTVALAPAIGAVVGADAVILWRRRDSVAARAAMAVVVAVTAVWAAVLLGRSPSWHPGLRTAVVVLGLAVAAALSGLPWMGRRVAAALAAGAVLVGLAAPAAYALETASTPHGGAIPSAGPAVSGGGFGPGGAAGRPGGFGNRGFGGTPPQGGFRGGLPAGPGGAAGTGGTTRGGNLGGLLGASTPSTALVTLLKAGSSGYTWTAAAVGSNSAAGVQLATGEPIMAIGGFNGTDPTPTLAQFKALVAAGKVHYFLGSGSGGGFGGFGGPGGSSTTSTSSQIGAWVAATFSSTTVGGQTVYDLTSETTAASTAAAASA